MKPFHELARTAQFRRLRPLALRALADYGLGETSVTPLQLVQNATYRVRRVSDGRQFLLRVHTPRWHDAQVIRSELLWLEALRAEDGFEVPGPVRTRRGELWTAASTAGVPEPRVCTLMTWVEGRLVGRRRSPSLLRKIGAFMARLHRQAERFEPPDGFVRPRWDHEKPLGQDTDTRAGWDCLTPSQKTLFEAVGRRLRQAVRRVGHGSQAFGLIHGDLTFPNLLLRRGQLCAIDFDDCGFGHFLYDLAILLDRIEMREDYRALRAALLEGYRDVRPLPREHEAELDTFLLARWVFLGLSFLSRPEHAGPREYAPRFMRLVEPKIEKYLRVKPARGTSK
jgi:Ser/Thr protein kinase RdoA (MazF antagonist)